MRTLADMLNAAAEPDADSPTLMAQVAAGDAVAFMALVQRLQGTALRVATKVLGSRSDADDAVQAALTKLWTEAHRYEPGRGSVEGWFRRILINLCLDRRRSVRVVQPLETAAEIASPGPTPFEAASIAARARRIDAAMARLNPRQRAAILLFHGEGASMAEVATALDTTPKAVEGLLARARIELSQLLASDRAEI
jgi:RNA polymerase sigma-70 factor (ECF subfamily)